MAPTLQDGVPGLEGIHNFNPSNPAGASWAFVLNDWMDPSTGKTWAWTTQAAWTLLTDIQGLHDRPDSDDPRVNLVFKHGELTLPRYARGRTITYTGIVAAKDMASLRSHIASIRAGVSSAITYPDGWNLLVKYDQSVYDSLNLNFIADGIPIGFTCDDNQPSPTTLPSPFSRQFVLTYRQADGRWRTDGDPSVLCTLGSSGSPKTSGSSGSLTMTGTAPAEPTFTILGTGAGAATITLAADEVGGTFAIDLPTAMASGDSLVIDFPTRTVTFNPSGGGSHDYTGYIDWGNTNWWIEPVSGFTLLPNDANTITVTGDHWYVEAIPLVW